MVAAAERYEIVRERAPLLVRMARTAASSALSALSALSVSADAYHPGGDRIYLVDRSSKAKLARFIDGFGQPLDMQAYLEQELAVLSADLFAAKWLTGAAPDFG
ncbi:MAG: hypothetical protein OEN21_18590 [Myxococcales bacterium]|nr:hypothetical protein [Myxococcales bacterium]